MLQHTFFLFVFRYSPIVFFLGRVLVSVLGKSCPPVSWKLFEGPEGLGAFEGVGEGFDFVRLPWYVPNADAWISETTSFIACTKLIAELACSCAVAGENPPVSNSPGCNAGLRAVVSVAASEYQSWFTTSMDPLAMDKRVSFLDRVTCHVCRIRVVCTPAVCLLEPFCLLCRVPAVPCTLYPILSSSGCKGTHSPCSCCCPIWYQPYSFPVLVLYPIGYHVLFSCFALKSIPSGANRTLWLFRNVPHRSSSVPFPHFVLYPIEYQVYPFPVSLFTLSGTKRILSPFATNSVLD